jgi:large subunit ribosomal protein L24
MKVKIGDTVLIITGKDAGKKGKVIRLLKEKERVVIEKVNLITKHVKKTRERAGERIE